MAKRSETRAVQQPVNDAVAETEEAAGTHPAFPHDPEYEQKRRDLEQLAACKSDLVGVISGQIDWLLEMEAAGRLREPDDVATKSFGPIEASKRARQPLSYEPGRMGPHGEFEPDQVSWHGLSNLMEHDPEKGGALWQSLKNEARREIRTGIRAIKALEADAHGRPYDRAQFLAILDALCDDLKPRGMLEYLLVQRMASAYEQCLRWQKEVVRKHAQDIWRGEADKASALRRMSPADRERYQNAEGWLPPRISESAAIDQAAVLADRYERAFLRLIREFRNYRRMFGSLIVTAEQVNIADGGPQQVNVN